VTPATSAHIVATAPVPISERVRITAINLQKSFAWAWLDTVCQYRRSRIGPLWDTINLTVMLVGLTLVSSSLFGSSILNIIGHAGIGIIVWSAIASLVLEAPHTFVRNCGYVTNSMLSLELYVGRQVFKTLITFSHHFILYFVGILFGLLPLSWVSLLALPGIALLFLNGCWVAMTLGMLCAKYRDLEPFVRNFMQLSFFVTPVFWNESQIAVHRRFLVEGNPFFYFIEIIRKPLLGEVPPQQYYLVVLGVTVSGFALAYYVHRRMRSHLAFYLV
jgi:ABC-type polysaccharide/polyol phosphate export permease